jgi:transposase
MKAKKPVFKPYHQHQLMVFPPTFEEMIPKDHPVRVVSDIVDQLDLDALIIKYKGGGCSSYHPRMLLKVLIYGYLVNIFSSRKLEAAIQENIYLMWLSGMEKPDHNTINRFRSERLRGVIKKVFAQVVLLMVESGHVDLQKVYTDGTKIEANANRYTFVWGKSIANNKKRIAGQLNEFWQYTQKIARHEMKDTTPTTFNPTSAEQVKETIDTINQHLKEKDVDPIIKKKLSYAKKHWPQKMKEYEEMEAVLGERNSFSKTDPDATFMRMKEDRLQNGELKPAYNTQISTNNQIITNYSIHQSPGDFKTLQPHLESFKEAYGFMPNEVIADAGYGSEQNYDYLQQNNIEGFVKYAYFDKELNKSDNRGPFHVENLFYNQEQNCYYCPMGQPMPFVELKEEKPEAGYERKVSYYQALNCEGCPLRGACNKATGNRSVQVSHQGRELYKKAKERLLSEQGQYHRRKRPVDVEPVFGMIKHNRGFRKFNLRGLDKVHIEFGLIAIAHNLKKIA